MSCCRSVSASAALRRIAADQQGVAALEGILVFAVIAGVLFACLLISQWSSSLQCGQMGARLLAFDAGDVELARMGRPSRRPVQQVTHGEWDTLPGISPATAGWLGGMFTLSNDFISARVTDTTHGRLPGPGSLFNLSPATMSYFSRDWTAAANPWNMTESTVRLAFLNIAYRVGRERLSPDVLDSLKAQAIPPAYSAIVETIYSRLGVR